MNVVGGNRDTGVKNKLAKEWSPMERSYNRKTNRDTNETDEDSARRKVSARVDRSNSSSPPLVPRWRTRNFNNGKYKGPARREKRKKETAEGKRKARERFRETFNETFRKG